MPPLQQPHPPAPPPPVAASLHPKQPGSNTAAVPGLVEVTGCGYGRYGMLYGNMAVLCAFHFKKTMKKPMENHDVYLVYLKNMILLHVFLLFLFLLWLFFLIAVLFAVREKPMTSKQGLTFEHSGEGLSSQGLPSLPKHLLYKSHNIFAPLSLPVSDSAFFPHPGLSIST